MFRNGFDFKVNDSILDQNGCFTSIYEQHLTLVCLYGNNTEKCARSLMIPKEVSEALNQRRTDNTMAKRKRAKG